MDWNRVLGSDSKRLFRVEFGREFPVRRSFRAAASDWPRRWSGSWPEKCYTGHKRNATRLMKHRLFGKDIR
jgi:hypothetical protein